MLNKFEIVILSRNRPFFLERNLKVISKNKFCKYITISDNSDITYRNKILLLSKNYKVRIIQRNEDNLYSHQKKCFEDSNKDFLMLFHDDDVFNDNFFININICLNYLYKNQLTAIGLNGNFYKDNKTSKNTIWNYDKKILKIKYEKELILKYLDNDEGGISPFSSYIYNLQSYKKNIINIFSKFEDINNPYNDTIFLLSLLNFGEIYWLNNSLVKIQIHNQSISSSTKFDYKKFITFIKINYSDLNFDSHILKYRFRNFLSLKIFKKKYFFIYFKIFCYLFTYSKSLRFLILKKMFKF
jgi:hypothetical protein